MQLDTFDPHDREALVGFRPKIAHEVFEWLAMLGDRLHVRLDGLENLPRGRALLVANHAFGFDAALPMALIHRATSRPVFALGEHLWWRFPFLRQLAAQSGVVDGTPENIDRLLQADHLVVVLPGGLRESLKPRELRYRMLWGNRYGFVKAAIRNRAPSLPLAGIGADDVFDVVGDAFARGARFFRRGGLPIPRLARLIPFPHLVPLRYVIGEPIDAGTSDDPARLRRIRREVEGALHELIEEELARRSGFSGH